MTSLSLFFLIILGILYGTYTRHRRESSRLKSLQKRYDNQNSEINYEYDKFNTNNQRNTVIRVDNNEFSLTTDLQSIRIANKTLVSRVSSLYDEIPVRFDIVIQPFEKQLFDVEGYKNFSQDGILILWSYGAHTKYPLEQIKELSFLLDKIPTDPGGVYLTLDSFTVDKSENLVALSGKFVDETEYRLTINYKSYILTFESQIESLMNSMNFKNIDELSENP